MKRRFVYLLLIVALFAPIAAAISPPKHTAADVSGGGANILLQLGQNCHDLDSIKHDFGLATNGSQSACHEDNGIASTGGEGWEEVLEASLGCSSDMFYQHNYTDPSDSSDTVKTRWYTHLGAYKDCYNKAQTMFNNMTNSGSSGECGKVAQGSQNYTNCLTDVQNLHAALGCSMDMIQPAGGQDANGNPYYKIDPGSGAVSDCQQRINDVGQVKIWIFQDGNRVQSAAISDASVTADSPDGSDDGNDVPTLSCNVSFNPLTWVICPAVQGLVSIVGDLDNAINSQLSVGSPGNGSDPNQIFCDSQTNSGGDVSNCKAYHAAWSSFRDIALGLLAIVGLVIIISEMAGLELLDAYTVRKVLPRLIFAAIAITLSWQLMQFFVELTNALGYGVRWLIFQPFVRAGISQISLSGGALVATNLVTGAAIIALSVFGLLTFAATAALAVLVAFLTLIARQLLIIILIIIAPIAIIAYVLPNTQGVYKLWWSSFSKALLMFPLIAAFIASGRVFAAVANNSNDNFVGQLMGFAAYFAPYFLIPMTFRFAGGAISAIGGFVNDRHRGAFDRLGNYRKQRFDTNMKDLAAGNRYKASNPFARTFNRGTRFAANAGSAGVMPHKWRSRYQAGLSTAEAGHLHEYMENNADFKKIAGNDDYLQATMENMGGGKTETDWRRYLSGQGYSGRALEQGVAQIRAAKRATNDEVFEKAAVIANASTGTGWKEGGAGAMMESINEAAGGDRDMAASMLADMRNRATQARRTDLAGAGFGGQAQMLNAMYSPDYNVDDQGKSRGRTITAAEATDKMNDDALFVQGPGALIGARGDSIKLLAPQMVKRLDRAHQAYTNASAADKPLAERRLKQEYAVLAGRYDAMSQAAPENAQIMADTVLGAGVAGKTIQQHIEDFRTDDTFLQMRREYGTNAAAAAAAGGAGAPGGPGAPGGIPGGGAPGGAPGGAGAPGGP
jgi:hypothetical protein